jgi:hypothetical protein
LFGAFRCAEVPEHHVELVAPNERNVYWSITVDGDVVADSFLDEGVLGYLTWAINRVTVASAAGAVFHSSAVAHGGAAIVVPGESGRGKSTLAAALVQAGCTYLTDEAVVCTDDGLVRPYPKPIQLDRSARELLGVADPAAGSIAQFSSREVAVPVEHLGGEVAIPSPIGLVVIASRTDDDETVVSSVSRATALVELLKNSYFGLERGRLPFEAAASALANARAVCVTYGDPRSAAVLLRNAC